MNKHIENISAAMAPLLYKRGDSGGPIPPRMRCSKCYNGPQKRERARLERRLILDKRAAELNPAWRTKADKKKQEAIE